MSVFANLFGYILEFLYNLIGNYGMAIILFCILVKLVMIPLSIKQQRTLKKNEKLQEEMKKIQFKYKNNPEKMNQEVMSLYKKEGVSPFSGCLSAIIQIILLFSVFLLVRSPLTYMAKMDTTVIDKMAEIVAQEDSSYNQTYREIAIIQYINNLEGAISVEENENEEPSEIQPSETESSETNISETESFETDISETDVMEENVSEEELNLNEYIDKANINMNFFGIDLSLVPMQDYTNWKVYIIPVLYVISSFISIKLTTALNSKKKKERNKKLITDGKEQEEVYDPMESANKSMFWFMPVMAISISIVAPLGLALYWLTNNALMIIERLIFNKIFNKEEEADKNAQ